MFMVNLKRGKTLRMGGCCCCLIKDVEPQRPAEEVIPLSSQIGSAPAIALGLLINTNLETSAANACMSPPAPVSHNVVMEYPHTAEVSVEVDSNKTGASVQTANSVNVEELVRGNNQENEEKDEDPKLSLCKVPSLVLEAENDSKTGVLEKVDQVMASAEECPTCLEEYNDENPKIITKCKHHFHLACILEWMERSDTCPVCNKEMTFSSLTNQLK